MNRPASHARLGLALWITLATLGCSPSVSPADGGDAASPLDAATDGDARADGSDAMPATDGADATPADGGTPALAPFQSGTRLRAHVNDGGDGARSFIDWYDTQLTVACAFRHATDGQWRCIPVSSDVPVFLDANCTTPGALHYSPDPSCTVSGPQYVVDNRNVHRCSPYESGSVYRLGGPLAGVTSYYVQGPAGCVMADTGAAQTLFAVTPVDNSAFVSATASTQTLTGGLGATALDATDGAHQVLTARDARRDLDCRPIDYYFANGDFRCVPDWAQGIPTFSDATCSTTVGIDEAACAPTLGLNLEITGCGSMAQAYALTGAVTTGYRSSGGMCTASMLPTQNSYWAFGTPLPDGDLSTLALVGVGTGRLRATYLGAGDVPLVRSNRRVFFDTTLGAACMPYPVNGTTRCLTRDVAVDGGGYFSDAACTLPISAIYVGTATCPATMPTRILRAVTDVCGNGTGSLHAVGPAINGTVYLHDGTGGCMADAPEPAFAFVEIGAAADETVFAPVTDVTE